MADETKIVEIVVKTTGDADVKRLGKALQDLSKQQKAAVAATKELNTSFAGMAGNIKGTLGLLGAGFTIKGLIAASEEMQQLNSQVKDIADSFLHAAFQASGFLDVLNDQSAWDSLKQSAADVGTYVGRVVKFLGEGAQLWARWMQALDPVSRALARMSEEQRRARAEAEAAQQRRIAAISRGSGTPLLEGVTVTASVNQGAREDRAAMEQAAREAERLAKAQAAAQAAAYAQVDALRLQVNQQQELTAALEESGEKYNYIKETQEENAKVEKLLEELRKAGVTDLQAQEAAIRAMYDGLRKNAQQQQQIRDVQEAMKTAQEDNAKALEETAQNMQKPLLEVKEALFDIEEAAQVVAHAFVGIFTGAVHNARDFFRTVLEGLAEVAAQQAILAALGNTGKASGSTASGILGWLAGVFAHAKGAAFDRGQVTAFASGGVVTRPTLFPMANGAGLMGEAGPEAVMPLKRTSSGRLGVEMTGGGGVTVVNNLGVPAIARTSQQGGRMEIILEAAHMGAQLAVAEVNRSVGSGYGATAQSMQRSYGLRRRG